MWYQLPLTLVLYTPTFLKKKELTLFAAITKITMSRNYLSRQAIYGNLMWLMLEENSFKFNDKHFAQTHGIAMGTKMAVAFSVIFLADLEKRLLAASPLKPFVWKRFIDDIFSLWNIPMEEVSIFVNFANSFHPMIYLWNVIRTRCFSRHRGAPRTSPFNSQNSRFTNPLQTHWKFSVYTLLILPPVQY